MLVEVMGWPRPEGGAIVSSHASMNQQSRKVPSCYQDISSGKRDSVRERINALHAERRQGRRIELIRALITTFTLVPDSAQYMSKKRLEIMIASILLFSRLLSCPILALALAVTC